MSARRHGRRREWVMAGETPADRLRFPCGDDRLSPQFEGGPGQMPSMMALKVELGRIAAVAASKSGE